MLSYLKHAKIQIKKRDTIRIGVVAVIDYTEYL